MGAERRSEPPPPTDASSAGAVARLAVHLDIALRETGLTLAQYRTMTQLEKGASAISALAKEMSVRPPSVTTTVEGLVTRGLVDRNPDPSIRRRIPLGLTEEGTALLHQAHAAVMRRLTMIASNDPETEVTDALAGLSRWHHALDAYKYTSEMNDERRRGLLAKLAELQQAGILDDDAYREMHRTVESRYPVGRTDDPDPGRPGDGAEAPEAALIR